MKILVTVMTGLIVIGLAFLVYGLSMKGGGHFGDSSAEKTEGMVCANHLRVPFGRITLNQAHGTQITAMVIANQCLLLLLEGGGEQGERVIVVDLVAGRVLGTVTVESAP